MQYNAVIKAIAAGSGKISEISGVPGLNDTGATSNYISKLISLGIIEKEFPYKTEHSRKTIYKLSDSMFRFWHRFVPANLSLIGRGAFCFVNSDRLLFPPGSCTTLHGHRPAQFRGWNPASCRKAT